MPKSSRICFAPQAKQIRREINLNEGQNNDRNAGGFSLPLSGDGLYYKIESF